MAYKPLKFLEFQRLIWIRVPAQSGSGLADTSFLLCPHVAKGTREPLSHFDKGTTHIHKGSTLVTNHFSRPTSSFYHIEDFDIYTGEGDTNIQSIADSI